MPYLVRRAQENSSLLSGAVDDIRGLGFEIRKRFLPGFVKPSLHEGRTAVPVNATCI